MSFSNENVKESNVIVPVEPYIKGEIRLAKVEKVIDANRDNAVYLDFTLEHVKTKATLRDRIFEPVDKTDNPPFPEYDFEKEKTTTLARVKHFQGRFMSEEKAKATSGNDWASYVDAVIASFPPNYSEVALDAKIVYVKSSNNKYYSGLPKYPPFLSSEKYPKSITSTGYDIYKMPAGVGASTAAPSSTEAAPVANASDEI